MVVILDAWLPCALSFSLSLSLSVSLLPDRRSVCMVLFSRGSVCTSVCCFALTFCAMAWCRSGLHCFDTVVWLTIASCSVQLSWRLLLSVFSLCAALLPDRHIFVLPCVPFCAMAALFRIAPLSPTVAGLWFQSLLWPAPNRIPATAALSAGAVGRTVRTCQSLRLRRTTGLPMGLSADVAPLSPVYFN